MMLEISAEMSDTFRLVTFCSRAQHGGSMQKLLHF